MQYNIKAIPTSYAGVNFRSRLEARWAAFFDLCGWSWDYEPFDLDGWAPDFLLKGKIKALVEVKPIDFSESENAEIRQARAKAAKAFAGADAWRKKNYLPEPAEDVSDEEFDEYIRSMERTTPEYEILVIGNGPFENDSWNKWGLGVFALDDYRDQDFADLFYGRSSELDYAARYNNFQYRIGGHHEGDGHLIRIDDDDYPRALWREAGNIVQWKPDNNNYRRRSAA